MTAEDVIAAVSDVPFEPAMRLLAGLQKALWFIRLNPDRQVALMRELYGDTLAAAGVIFTRREPRRALLSEQQVFALQRVLVLHARDQPADDLSPEESARLRLALLWTPDTMLDPDLKFDEREQMFDVADERWMRLFIGTGGLVSHAALRHELARAHRMYSVIAQSAAALKNENYCPLDEWLKDVYRLTFVELQSLGLAMLAGAKIHEEIEPPVLVTPSYFDSTILAERIEDGFKAFAAPREWFRAEFEASGEHPRRAAYETQPFLRRPGLLQTDGSVAVIAPRAIEGWMSATGAYYLLLDIARGIDEETRKRFSRFNGWIQERYTRHLTYVAHPDQPSRRIAVGRVHPEKKYRVRKGESKTSDVAIDVGTDLVLVEVTSKRVTEKSLVEANIESVIKDVRILVLENMKQHGRVIRDLNAGRVTHDGINMHLVKRIWPIIVAPDGLFHTPTVWAWIHREGAHYLEFSKEEVPQAIQPLVLLDLEEYEILMGLAREHANLLGVLEGKTSPLWRERDLKAWLSEKGLGDDLIGHDFIGQEVHRAFAAMTTTLGLRRGRSQSSAGQAVAPNELL